MTTLPVATSLQEETLLRKVTLRLIPFMFILYIFNYLDRQNVGYAKLVMLKDIGMSDASYGFGAGIFFIAYFLFEIPSNLILVKVGAKRWIARIMFTWGIISCGMMFVSTPMMFYVMRFLLGVAEAGFFPGMILYLTYWFPARDRARAISRFMIATPLSGAIGGPISGYIIKHMSGFGGLASWKWMFLLEGFPSFLLGFVVLAYLPNGPSDAKWMSSDERELLKSKLDSEDRNRAAKGHMSWQSALASPVLLQLTAFYFALQIAIYGFNYWLPTIIKSFKFTDSESATITFIPYSIAAIAMVVSGHFSDKTGNRKGFVGGASLTAALGLSGGAYGIMQNNQVIALVFFTIAAIGLWSTLGPFWSLPTSFLTGTAAAGGIAFINSVGNLGGFVGPNIMGLGQQITHSDKAGIFVLATAMLIAALLAFTVHHDRSLEQSPGLDLP